MADLRSLVSVMTPQEDAVVLRLCKIMDSRVLPPSSTCLHQQGANQAEPGFLPHRTWA